MNEIGVAFAGTGFFVIWRSRDSATNDLAGNVRSHTSIRQGVHDFGDAGGKPPQSIGEFLRRHVPDFHMTNDRFSMTNFHLFQALNACTKESAAMDADLEFIAEYYPS